jgi:hypothetical protein
MDMSFSMDEIQSIQMGVIPEEMEDKWFIYWERNTLYCHRSWTGFCVYVVRFACDEDGAKAFEADLNRDSKQYNNTDDQYDAEMIPHLIDAVLLRRPSPFPSRSQSDTKRVLEQWSQVGRAGLGEHPGGEGK